MKLYKDSYFGGFVGYSGCRITNFRWRFQYSGAGCHSPIFLHHGLDPVDVVGNIGEDTGRRLRKDSLFGGTIKCCILHLITLIFHQLPTDNTNQNVPFFRTNNCQWPSAVPLFSHTNIMNALEIQKSEYVPHRWLSVCLWRKVKTVHLCRHLNIVIDTYHSLLGRP